MAIDIIARGLSGSALTSAELANQRIDALPKGLIYKGAVNYRADLDNLAASVGDTYTVKYKGTSGTEAWGAEFAYGNYEGSNQWIEIGGNYDEAIAALQAGKQDLLVSGTNIKTVNGNSLLGSGNVDVKTYQPFPNGTLSGTLAEIVTEIKEFPNRAQGMAYLGSIEGACTPFGYGNAECMVTFATSNIAILSVSSSNVAPYRWEYNTAQNDYKWRAFCILPDMPTYSTTKNYQLSIVPEGGSWRLSWIEGGSTPGGDGVTDVLVNGTSVVSNKEALVNIKTINQQDVAGTGNITIENVPDKPTFTPGSTKSYMLMCVPNEAGTGYEFKWGEFSASDPTDNNNNGIPDEDEETLPMSSFIS